jgi:large subunit ribosomal protein L11
MASKKEVNKRGIKLKIAPGVATAAPPVGTVLGQAGVNIMEFCKDFNNRTAHLAEMYKGFKMRVFVTSYTDKSYDMVVKLPDASTLIAKAAGIAKGSGEPNKTKVGKINKKQLEEIAKLKKDDLTAVTMKEVMNTLVGTARSMGLEVEGV